MSGVMLGTQTLRRSAAGTAALQHCRRRPSPSPAALLPAPARRRPVIAVPAAAAASCSSSSSRSSSISRSSRSRSTTSCSSSSGGSGHRAPRPSVAAAAASGAAAAGGGGGDAAPAPAPPSPGALERAAQSVVFLFPLWVVGAALLGLSHPPLFAWFTDAHVTAALMATMLAMGLTLTFQDIAGVFTRTPGLLALGMGLQYTVLPALGWLISRYWGLDRELAIGVALVSCMPGGTASNVVAFIAKGDMPLSIMMTTASTLAAIVTTPLLTSLLVGALVPVDARAMFLSVCQLVLGPVLAGALLNQLFPKAVARARAFTPLLATVLVVLIVGSLTSANAAVVRSSGGAILSAVFCLHSAGFALGYGVSKSLGLSDRIARTNSIEVGMQSSALAAVIARAHFSADPAVVAPCVLSACCHATIGSLLAGYWSATSRD